MDEPFVTKDGREIMYPGDPTAEAGLVYNCRCTLTYVYDVGKSRENLREREKARDRFTDEPKNGIIKEIQFITIIPTKEETVPILYLNVL